MSLLKTKKHRELERLWYDKLKAEGFEDCEDTEHPERPLKAWHDRLHRHPDPRSSLHITQIEAISAYYAAAGALLHEQEFEISVHRKIWELHCEGLSRSQIEEVLAKTRFRKKLKRSQIQNIINKIARNIR